VCPKKLEVRANHNFSIKGEYFMPDKEKAEELKDKKPLKDVTGKKLNDKALKDVAGGRGRMGECTTNSNTLDRV
jgi:hypothetical protein